MYSAVFSLQHIIRLCVSYVTLSGKFSSLYLYVELIYIIENQYLFDFVGIRCSQILYLSSYIVLLYLLSRHDKEHNILNQSL